MVNAAERAYQSIREAILAGEYEAGNRLREEQLSSELGVSRTPVREALRRLAAESLIEFLPHRGAHVASWSSIELQDIFELRVLLEGYAARRAATRLNDEDIDRLDKLAVAMEDAGTSQEDGLEQTAELNTEFHSLIVRNAESQLLVSFAETLVQIPLVHRTFRRYSQRDLARSFNHHRELVEAFRLRDGAWAEAVMRAHVFAARHIFDPVETGEEADSDDE